MKARKTLARTPAVPVHTKEQKQQELRSQTLTTDETLAPHRLRVRILRATQFTAVLLAIAVVGCSGSKVVTLENGDRWEGDLLSDKPFGRGGYTWINGNRYEGEIFAGFLEGHGVFTTPAGDRYEGEYRQGKRHGRGTFNGADGVSYVGEFRDGKPNGRGVYTWADGSRYEGEFRDDKRHGRGVYARPDGRRYEGEFRDDRRHGFGVLTTPDGGRYEQSYVDGKQVPIDQSNTPSAADPSLPSADILAEGGLEQENPQKTTKSANTASTDTPPGGCQALLEQFEVDFEALSQAMKDYDIRTRGQSGLGGLGGCGALIVGYNSNLNYAEALRRCPEVDPTGEQLAAVEVQVESMANGADQLCAGGVDTRQRYSMKEILDRLRNLTPVDEWR